MEAKPRTGPRLPNREEAIASNSRMRERSYAEAMDQVQRLRAAQLSDQQQITKSSQGMLDRSCAFSSATCQPYGRAKRTGRPH